MEIADEDLRALLVGLAAGKAPSERLIPHWRGFVADSARRIAEAAGVPKVNARELRRTFATLAARRGRSLDDLAFSMGHGADATATTARQHYIAPGAGEAGAAAIENYRHERAASWDEAETVGIAALRERERLGTGVRVVASIAEFPPQRVLRLGDDNEVVGTAVRLRSADGETIWTLGLELRAAGRSPFEHLLSEVERGLGVVGLEDHVELRLASTSRFSRRCRAAASTTRRARCTRWWSARPGAARKSSDSSRAP